MFLLRLSLRAPAPSFSEDSRATGFARGVADDPVTALVIGEKTEVGVNLAEDSDDAAGTGGLTCLLKRRIIWTFRFMV